MKRIKEIPFALSVVDISLWNMMAWKHEIDPCLYAKLTLCGSIEDWKGIQSMKDLD